MSSRLTQQHAAYAQRVEQENNRVQATQAVNSYYSHWGKVTSRFDNWTNEKYYEKAGQQIQSRREKEEKEAALNDRRNRLRQLLTTESEAYDNELERRRRPREPGGGDLQMLGRVNQSLKEQEQLRRKLEMEAKLYGRWRHGVDDEKLLYQSKSDNEVLAKLNWLDRQIENQQQKEEQQALAAERQLLLQQEISRTEQAQKERQQIREQQLRELRALQESHMSELRLRQQEAEKLKEEEQHFQLFLGELDKERELLEESSALVLKRVDSGHAFNLKKIKVFIRQRSEASRKQISLCINMLQRMAKYVVKTEELQALLEKYRTQLEHEELACAQIETMYESEAKYNLQRCEENWREQHLQRYNELSKFIDQEKDCLGLMLQENVSQQQTLVELRSQHLTGIEQANKQLEQLSQEEVEVASQPTTNLKAVESKSSVSESSVEENLVPKVSDSFSNLNLDVWQDLPPARGEDDLQRLNKSRSLNVVTSQTAVPPKFARKRVAWT
ncbi:trichoplein keratin filament-binding protein [Drosophila ficusphila]|uniref:trichoplein keratin filament-binding protein n=1 Tax=Drosophila ficusphila TaxID=30025 RepID=UPI0007E682E5|nr:trichoplein keratin filament-binding protein [Drosophila ficusphila]XP_017062142.1 trichoplein keratin filament-binding protein [Drosophila ficusphila]